MPVHRHSIVGLRGVAPIKLDLRAVRRRSRAATAPLFERGQPAWSAARDIEDIRLRCLPGRPLKPTFHHIRR